MSKYKMTIDLNVLNHLGINLYSEIPSVLAEAVANSYDADASIVSINVFNNEEDPSLEIIDNGLGMELVDINNRFLKVGYKKERKDEKGNDILTPVYNRKPMGRKGIGKLSLLSIANIIEIHSLKENGSPEAFQINVLEIQKQIEEEDRLEYEPTEIKPDITSIGTKIVLKDIRKNRSLHDLSILKKAISRKFSVFSDTFKIFVNEDEVTITDRKYFDKVILIRTYGESLIDFDKECKKITDPNNKETGPSVIKINGVDKPINGWIGLVDSVSDLKDDFSGSLNYIAISSRGKVGQEDILNELHDNHNSKLYIIGEINADFLDDVDDLATSNREKYIKQSDEYEALQKFLKTETNSLANSWNRYKDKSAVEKATSVIPEIKEWLSGMKNDDQKMAQKLLVNINKGITNETDRKELTKYGVLAFEKLKMSKQLSLLEHIDMTKVKEFSSIFLSINDIEASMYHQIVTSRLEVIKKFRGDIEANVKEKLIQQLLFNHLWLLDPSWERPIYNATMEKKFKDDLIKYAGLTEEEEKSRYDIKFTNYTGKTVILELKRSERRITLGEVISQVKKYSSAMSKIINANKSLPREYEIIFIAGKFIDDEIDPHQIDANNRSLESWNCRFVHYDTLISNSLSAYSAYLSANDKLNDIIKILSV